MQNESQLCCVSVTRRSTVSWCVAWDWWPSYWTSCVTLSCPCPPPTPSPASSVNCWRGLPTHTASWGFLVFFSWIIVAFVSFLLFCLFVYCLFVRGLDVKKYDCILIYYSRKEKICLFVHSFFSLRFFFSLFLNPFLLSATKHAFLKYGVDAALCKWPPRWHQN